MECVYAWDELFGGNTHKFHDTHDFVATRDESATKTSRGVHGNTCQELFRIAVETCFRGHKHRLPR